MDLKDQRACSFCVGRSIKKLYKSYLSDLEEILNNGKITQEEFEVYRKRILDNGNDQIREVNEFLENYKDLSYISGESEFSDMKKLSELITNTVANLLIEWDNLRKRNENTIRIQKN